jgi:hypothetical protein
MSSTSQNHIFHHLIGGIHRSSRRKQRENSVRFIDTIPKRMTLALEEAMEFEEGSPQRNQHEPITYPIESLKWGLSICILADETPFVRRHEYTSVRQPRSRHHTVSGHSTAPCRRQASLLRTSDSSKAMGILSEKFL